MQDKIYKVLQKHKQNINNVYTNYKQLYIKRINKVYKNAIRKIVKNQLLYVHLYVNNKSGEVKNFHL